MRPFGDIGYVLGSDLWININAIFGSLDSELGARAVQRRELFDNTGHLKIFMDVIVHVPGHYSSIIGDDAIVLIVLASYLKKDYFRNKGLALKLGIVYEEKLPQLK